ncbi:MAG: hypothetical protein AAGF32_08450, partial [Pseudomonadota bacterium]
FCDAFVGDRLRFTDERQAAAGAQQSSASATKPVRPRDAYMRELERRMDELAREGAFPSWE